MHDATRALLRWYRAHQRDLPWRTTRDPYHIFVSELMLQQTQVDRVIPKFQTFLKTFPSWTALANATTADLIHAWAGLGYNRRALYARAAAKHVVAHGVPTTEIEWRALKGVGPYMAAALTEFVNHTRALVIDTNIRRVVGRLMLGVPYPSPTDDKQILKALDTLTPEQKYHWDVPQAFMDLANAVCFSSTPNCSVCPLQKECRSATKFLSSRPPTKPKRISTERIHRDKPFPDRIYRGRLLTLVREHGHVQLSAVGMRIDANFDAIADRDWLRALASRLAKDGLLIIGRGDTLSLPNS
jgi:A/G-specific adenine glycosylase